MATKTKRESEWVGFPTSSFLNPIPNPYNFTNPLSKTVLLIADNNYVSEATANYLDTTLCVSGFKVTKFTSISSTPLCWTSSSSLSSSKSNESSKSIKDESKDEHFWEYNLDLNDFDCILIPSQLNGDIWNDITSETQTKIKQFVEKGGCLVLNHFRATNFINSVCNVSWHEISVKIGASYHVRKNNDVLNYVNDVRGIVNINKDDIIYKTKDDLTTVGFKQYGKGYCYYIGHDFSAIWEKTWNKILFNSIKKILTNSDQEIMNLSFGDIDIDAFKNLNIKSNDNDNDQKDIYLEEFEPDFQSFQQNGKENKNKDDVENKNESKSKSDTKDKMDNDKEDITNNTSFDDFDDLNGTGFDDNDNKQTDEYESIGYVQMDDNGIITINDQIQIQIGVNDDDVGNKNQQQIISDDDDQNEDQDENESLEEVD